MFDAEIGLIANSLDHLTTKRGRRIIGLCLLGKGDGSGVLVVPNGLPREIWARRSDTRELFTLYLPPNSVIAFQDGDSSIETIEMRYGYDTDNNRLQVLDALSSGGQQAVGSQSPIEATIASAYWTPLDHIITLRASPTDPVSTSITVTGPLWYARTPTSRYLFSTSSIPLTSQISGIASGKHQLAVIYLDTATGSLGALTNTAVTAAGSLPSRSEWAYTDVQAISIPSTYIPIIVLYLYYGQTAIAEADFYRTWDLRPLYSAAPTIPGACSLRLTTQTGIAVDTADRTGQSTIYATPYLGNLVEVWNGAQRVQRTLSADISVAVPSTKFRLFDVFVYDNSGSLALETVNWNQSTGSITGATNATPIVITSNSHGLSNGAVVAIDGLGGNTSANGKLWVIANVATNTFELVGSAGNGAYTSGGTWYSVPNTRATGISLGSNTGCYIKSGDETRRYLGTGMTGATSGQLDDSQANRLLWNYYNRVQRISVKSLLTDHNYNSITTRFWNNDGQSKYHFIVGVVEDACHVGIGATMAVDTNLNQAYLGAQLNGVTAITTGAFYVWSNTTYFNQNVVSAPQTPTTGLNFVAALQLVVSGTGYYYQAGSLRGDFWG